MRDGEEQQPPDATQSKTQSITQWQPPKSLHFTMYRQGSQEWQRLVYQMGSHVNCVNANADIVIAVEYIWELELQISEAYKRCIVERVELVYHNPDGKSQYVKVRWRVFVHDGIASKATVPHISAPEPSQPYAEIWWVADAVVCVEIKGLEKIVSRGRSIARDAVLLAQAVDALVLPRGWRIRPIVPFDEGEKPTGPMAGPATKVENPDETVSADERLWRSEACPAAKALGRRNGKLTQETLAEEMDCSTETVKGRKKKYPNSWPLIEAAFNEGKQEYAEEQMSKAGK